MRAVYCLFYSIAAETFLLGCYCGTSGFWPRVRARALRAPVFLDSLPHQTGRCAHPPPIAASMLHIYTPKPSLRPELGPPGACIFPLG
jgi:hypothetical protein